MTKDVPICPYCGNSSELADSAEVYRKSYGPIYICRPCNAWVGCHKGTETPLGRLANAELRTMKKKAHAAFDPLWRAKIRKEGVSKKRARGAGYKWLAKQLGVRFEDCHIGMFDEETCQRVVDVCSPYLKKGGAR